MSYPSSLPRERSPKPPLHTNTVDEKLYLIRKNSPQNSRLALPIPLGARTRTRFTERRVIASLFLFLTWFALGWMGYISAPGTILSSLFRKSTAVFGQADLEKIWRWEIASGHYPSTRSVPTFVGTHIQNPGLPAEADQSEHSSRTAATTGTGPARTYMSVQNVPSGAKYPPRPPPGGIADLDTIMDRCDFSTHKYVRDCLEFMRIGAGLDPHKQLRLTHPSLYEFIYLENNQTTLPDATDYDTYPAPERKTSLARIFNRHHLESLPPLPPPRKPKPLDDACDPDHPRIFHAYWVGEFTDKPYMALLSYLFTQNLGLDRKIGAPLTTNPCRPQFWVWINPGPAAAVPNPAAEADLFDSLRANPWARPFLHPRFADVIKFKLWNTTEQLDSVPELKDEWRAYKGNFYDYPSTVLSDVARFVLCHRFGGTYLDTDTILLRDWEELWGYKGAFAYRWSRLEAYSTAVLRLNKGSALGTFLFRTALRHGLDFHPMAIGKYVQQANLEGLLLRLPDALFDSAWLNTEGYQRERPALPYFTQFENFFEPSKAEAGSPSVVGFDGFFRGAYSYHFHNSWWLSFDLARNYPDLGSRFARGETLAEENLASERPKAGTGAGEEQEDLSWAATLERTFEAFMRGERPNMYGEWIEW